MRKTTFAALSLAGICILATHSIRASEPKKPHPYRLPSVNIKEQVIWGSICDAPDGTALSFGGEDRETEDGLSHTRLRVNGQWTNCYEAPAKEDPADTTHGVFRELATAQKDILTQARSIYFQGSMPAEQRQAIANAKLVNSQESIAKRIIAMAAKLSSSADAAKKSITDPDPASVATQAQDLARQMETEISPDTLAAMRQMQVALEKIADQFNIEPPARALSPIVYEPKSKRFYLFGGDHFDYLTNDIWSFDPADRKWTLHHPKSAPPPRANHTWKVSDDGKLILTGGYTYFSNTDYMGGQYVDLNDGEWTYDVAADTWTGTGKAEPPSSRTYRTGPFLPEHFYDAPKPDAAESQATLKALAPNVWTKTNPPQLPKINRDWGSAVLDGDRDMILRFSGGHCAHGGSDVLQYHLATNRWELCYPVEFPLGQLYDNTEYPGGYNFNHRPWISGHTYQNYGIDPILKKMIFLGHSPWGYVYDPDQGDWTTRHALPKDMNYSGSMYTLTTTPTPQGLICWTDATAEVFRFDAAAKEWKLLHTTGEKLPSSSVDNSTVVYDSHRDRLLFFRKGYGNDKKYDGEIHALDLKSMEVSHLSPAGKEAAGAIPYLCQIRYDAQHDLLLVGATLPPDGLGLRRTPAYDCAANKWVSLKITGVDPSGKEGRNVSLGMMYDSGRQLFWAVDTNSQVYVLRLDPKSGDVRALG